LGLTGVILRATLRLLRVQTSRMRVDTERAANLDDVMARMEARDGAYRYSVAWLDSLASGAHLGRAVLTRGDHAAADELDDAGRAEPLAYALRVLPSVPPSLPAVLTRSTARAFNELWYRKAPRLEQGRVMPLAPFFYPLDAVADWNRLYGRRGFVQHQFVVPFGAESVIQTVLERFARAGCPSFLGVLKRFGPGRGMLSFPIAGWTLALDLPTSHPRLASLLDASDHEGGRVYFAQDSRLDPALVPSMYPDLERWRAVRERVDPHRRLRSDLQRRLGLDPAETWTRPGGVVTVPA